MRTMVDSDNAATMPGGFPVYAANVNGRSPQFPLLAGKFPTASYLPIGVSSQAHEGLCGDAETGDGPWTRWVTWVVMRRADGVDPWLYAGWDWHAMLVNRFASLSIPQPWWWIADPLKKLAAPEGRILALQQTYTAGYDLSVVADYLPGVDPAPANTQEETSMGIALQRDADGTVTVAGVSPAGHPLVFVRQPGGQVNVYDLTDQVEVEDPKTPAYVIK